MKPETPTREQRLEAALQIIQTWAACFDSRVETADKAMDDIENKCREALTTGEGGEQELERDGIRRSAN